MASEKLYAWEDSIWRWRSGGMATYEAMIVGLVGVMCFCVTLMAHLSPGKAILAVFSLRNIGLFLAVWVLHVGLMQVEATLLKACSPMPLAVTMMKPLRGAMHQLGHLSAAFSSLRAVRDTVLFLTTSAAVAWASICCFLLLLHRQGVGTQAMCYGIALGLLHGLLAIARGNGFMQFPIIHRQRLFAVKKELLHAQGLLDVAMLSIVSLAASSLASHMVGRSRGRFDVPFMSAALLSGALTVFCMRMGYAIVNIVSTEHLRFAAPGDTDPNARLFAALQDKQRPLWQALALQDLAHLCQGGPSERWRRSAILDDESGQCWSTVVQHCLGEVEEMVRRTAAGLPQVSKPAEKKAAAMPSWNIHSASTKAFGGGNRAQDEALSYQRSRCWHAVQSMRSLSDLCTASYTEDRLGTAQLAQPNIGAVTAVLASTVLAMQAYARTSGASGKGANLELAQSQSALSGGRQAVAVPALSLQDAALSALYGLVGCFGRDLEPLVRGCSHKLPYGTSSEAAALLSRCSALQE